MSEVKLEPCPFCGSDEAGTAKGRLYSYGQCGRCGATSSAQTTNEKAAKAWNTRTPHPAHAAVEAMAQALEKIAGWFEAQAKRDDAAAKSCRFESLNEAYRSDAKNYRAMAKDARTALAAYRATQNKDVRP